MRDLRQVEPTMLTSVVVDADVYVELSESCSMVSAHKAGDPSAIHFTDPRLCCCMLVLVQDRVWLSSIDDGEQLGPLSPQIKEGDRGFTAAWGRLHGTQVQCSGLLTPMLS